VTVSPDATYAADVLGKLLEDPNGKFKSDIFNKVPGLYKKEYMSAWYATQRDGGYIVFSTYMILAPRQDTFGRLAALKKAFLDEVGTIASTPGYFTQNDYTVLKRQIADQRIWERETVDGFINELSFWWSTASTAYYLGYNDALQKVVPADITKYLTDYVLARPSVLSVSMNPDDFDKEKASAQQKGWTVVSKDNAYWWADLATGGVK
jgi:zinc protease